MGDLKVINIIYSLEDEINIISKLRNKNIFKENKHIIKEKNIIKIFTYYSFCFDKYKINIINYNDQNYFYRLSLFYNCSGNILICSNEEKNIFIKDFNNLNKLTFIENKYINNRRNMDIIVLFKEILYFYINKNNLNLKNMFVYISKLNDKENIGMGVYNTLKECSKLYNQKEVKINIISSDEINIKNLYYIIDPLLEYTSENSKVKFENIIQNNIENNFLINILGAE